MLLIKHVAEFCELGWDAVKSIDKEWLERTLGEPDLLNLTPLALDEFAIRRGQRYDDLRRAAPQTGAVGLPRARP